MIDPVEVLSSVPANLEEQLVRPRRTRARRRLQHCSHTQSMSARNAPVSPPQESKKWSDRKEALEALHAVLNKPKLMKGDYGNITRMLKKVRCLGAADASGQGNEQVAAGDRQKASVSR